MTGYYRQQNKYEQLDRVNGGNLFWFTTSDLSEASNHQIPIRLLCCESHLPPHTHTHKQGKCHLHTIGFPRGPQIIWISSFTVSKVLNLFSNLQTECQAVEAWLDKCTFPNNVPTAYWQIELEDNCIFLILRQTCTW